MKILATGILSAASLGLILSCGGGGGGGSSSYTPPPPPPPPANTIYVGDNSGYGTSNIFTPVTLTVTAGTTVTWNWQASGHTVDSGTACTPDAAGPDHYSSNGVQAAGYTMTHTFATAGTYHYYCTTHCSTGMTGTIVVN
jgi:plastocyanin